MNVFLGSNINCSFDAARRHIRSPGGKSVCFIAGAGDGVDIRYTKDGIEYIFSFVDTKAAERADPKSPVGTWALSVVDSYR